MQYKNWSSYSMVFLLVNDDLKSTAILKLVNDKLIEWVIVFKHQLGNSKSSLDFFQQCNVGTGRQNYLNDNNIFRTSRLKLLARTKTIPLNKYLNRMNLFDDDRCLLCTADVSEDLEHFLLECTSLSNVRNEFFELFQSVSSYYSIDFIELPPSATLQFLTGEVAYLFDDRLGCFYDTHGRFYVEKCFKARCEIMDWPVFLILHSILLCLISLILCRSAFKYFSIVVFYCNSYVSATCNVNHFISWTFV